MHNLSMGNRMYKYNVVVLRRQARRPRASDANLSVLISGDPTSLLSFRHALLDQYTNVDVCFFNSFSTSALEHEVEHLRRVFHNLERGSLFAEGPRRLFFVESDKGVRMGDAHLYPSCDESVEVLTNLTTFHVACIRNELEVAVEDRDVVGSSS